MLLNYFLSTKGRNHIIQFFLRNLPQCWGLTEHNRIEKGIGKKGEEFKQLETYTKLLPRRDSTIPKDPKAKVLLKNVIRLPSIQRLCKFNK